MIQKSTILLTGATGYVGQQLLPHLLSRGHMVKCIVHDAKKSPYKDHPNCTFIEDDVTNIYQYKDELLDCTIAIYLIHSLSFSKNFEHHEEVTAKAFVQLCETIYCKHIIYLGGLMDDSEELSPHLSARLSVGKLLRASSIPVTTFRASIILGAGGISFEMIRNLTENLPIMITPKWVQKKTQPILINDALAYLLVAIDQRPKENVIYEIGGPDVLSYSDLMRAYAAIRKLRRWIIPISVLTPYLSSLWLNLITPIYAQVGRRLIQSMTCSTTIKFPEKTEAAFPTIQPSGVETAFSSVLMDEDDYFLSGKWMYGIDITQSKFKGKVNHRYIELRSNQVSLAPNHLFDVLLTFGGSKQWYFCAWLWTIRGLINQWLGGDRFQYRRPNRQQLKINDVVDWWKVVVVDSPHRLSLQATMKVPGRAWLEYHVVPIERGSRLVQVAIFEPKGVLGKWYWWITAWCHAYIFSGMLNQICAIATKNKKK